MFTYFYIYEELLQMNIEFHKSIKNVNQK